MKRVFYIFALMVMAGCGHNPRTANNAADSVEEQSKVITLIGKADIFVDLDFDGEDELVTGYTKEADTPRGVGRYTRICKMVDGVPQDVTDYFTAKSPLFEEVDEYFFKINTERKEIIYYESDGIYASGWQVHKFENGEYIYDRYVKYVVRDQKAMQYDVLVTTPQGDTIRSFTVDKDTFHKENWSY